MLDKQPLPPFITPDDHVILFDGVCKLCNAWSKFILKYDKKHIFKLASVQSKEGQALLEFYGYPTNFYDTMLVISDNSKFQKVCFEKSDAFFVVMKKLGFPYNCTLIFKILPKVIRDWFYDRVALNRYKLFGKYESCILPTDEHKKRFLNGE